MEYDNEMTAVLFVNDKAGNPKRPDYWGRLTLAGTEYRLAGWKKTNEKYGTFLSIKVEINDEAPKAAPSEPEPEQETAPEPSPDEIPF